MNHGNPITEDFTDLNKRREELRNYSTAIREQKCFIHLKLNSAECWCRNAAPGGGDLPCPSKPTT